MTSNVLESCRTRRRKHHRQLLIPSVAFLLGLSTGSSNAFCYVSIAELSQRNQITSDQRFRKDRQTLHARSSEHKEQRNGDFMVLFAVDLSESTSNSNSSIDDEYEIVCSSPMSMHGSVGSGVKDLLEPLKINGDSISHHDTNGYKKEYNASTKQPDDFLFPTVIPVITSGESTEVAFFNITRISADSFVSNFEQAKIKFFQQSSEAISTTAISTSSAFSAGQQFAANATSRVTEPFRNMYTFAFDQARALLNSTLQAMENDLKLVESNDNTETEFERLSLRRLWRRRHARTLEEGIRREKATELSDLLNRAQIDTKRPEGRKYVERTLMGLINALAEEVEDLDIELTTKTGTPLWRKEVEEIRINFSRLGFKPIRMGGSDKYDRKGNAIIKETTRDIDDGLSLVESADEAFNRIDKDKSGTLDQGEIAEALSLISELETDKDSIDVLASELVSLYDVNSDGVVDRDEYQQMVEDMAKLRPLSDEEPENKVSPLKKVKDSVQSISKGISERAAQVAAKASGSVPPAVDPNEREMGSIILSDLNLDLRRLLFGGLPLVKRITPGGPLILEPFTATIRGSFTREDFMGSFLLDAGLRLLVARAIRVRLRSFRDVVDGAYFFGRKWTLKSKSAPAVQVLGLSNVEFSGEKVILTGRARIRTSPDAPVVTNTFKVRTKFGTGNKGQIIGLREPELAFVVECPQTLENGYVPM